QNRQLQISNYELRCFRNSDSFEKLLQKGSLGLQNKFGYFLILLNVLRLFFAKLCSILCETLRNSKFNIAKCRQVKAKFRKENFAPSGPSHAFCAFPAVN